MVMKSSDPNGEKSRSRKIPIAPGELDNRKNEMKPVEKLKVNRSRRRLYETPEEEKQKDSEKKAVQKTTVSKEIKSKIKSVSGSGTGTSKKQSDFAKRDSISRKKNKAQQAEKDLLAESNRIVEKYSALASGSVLLPIPLVDIAYITGIQLKMLNELTKKYDIEFKRNRGKAIVTALISGIFANRFMFSTAPFLIRYIPVVGYLVAPLSIVLFSSALTYSVGKVFIQHFEAGGTFLNFKPEEVKAHFKKEFQRKYQSMKDDS
ncbi:MAG: DUF697 domain-containing protein [Balneolaceae bacterium]|nr:MAG: DUF697 domain-containing protein [Balneolaceae bacterium]